MSKLVDEMILFFQKVRVLDSPGRIKENLVLRAAEIEGLKGFEEAADAELQFVNASKMLDRELKQLRIKFEKGDEQYCPELDRFLMYAKMVRAELAQVPRSLLDPDLKELLETKHQEAIKSQLELLDLKSQVRIVDVDMVSQVAPMKPFHEVTAEFCRTNQRMKAYILRKWLVMSTNPSAANAANSAEPPIDIKEDVEMIDVDKFVSREWYITQAAKGYRSDTVTIEKVEEASKNRVKRVRATNQKYAKSVLETMVEQTQFDSSGQPTLVITINVLFAKDIDLDAEVTDGDIDTIKTKVTGELKKSFRHALEAAQDVKFGDTHGTNNLATNHWQELFTKKGETYHLGLIVKRCLARAGKAPDPPRQQSRGIFEVEVLVALRDKVNAEAKAEAAVNSSIEALTLFSEFANTVPDKAMMLKDPSTLLRIQGLDTSNVKQLSDKTGYRVLFPVLNSDETPDGVHLVAHQILNPYLLDIMHRSKEMQSALNNAWDVYKSHTKGRELVALALNQIVTAKKTFKFT